MAKANISEMLRARNKAAAEAEKMDAGFDYMADDVQGTEDLAAFGGLAFERPRMINAPIKELHAFHTRDIGFKPYDTGSLESLAQSIKEDGLMQRIKVRPDPSGKGFEILAGHNRAKAMSEILKQHTIPAELYNVDDDQAAIIAVTTNVKQRHYLRPSERAMAYRALMEAKRHQGKYVAEEWGEGVSEDTEDEIATQKTTRDKIAVMFDVDRNNVQRFLRLSYLIPELLEYADTKTLSVLAGVQLSYYNEDIQRALADVFKTRAPMTIKVVKAIRKACPEQTATVETFMAAWDEAERATAEEAAIKTQPAVTAAPATVFHEEHEISENRPGTEAAQDAPVAFHPADNNDTAEECLSVPAASDEEYAQDNEGEPVAKNTPAFSEDIDNDVNDCPVDAAEDNVDATEEWEVKLFDKAQEFAAKPSKKILHEIEDIINQIKIEKNW